MPVLGGSFPRWSAPFWLLSHLVWKITKKRERRMMTSQTFHNSHIILNSDSLIRCAPLRPSMPAARWLGTPSLAVPTLGHRLAASGWREVIHNKKNSAYRETHRKNNRHVFESLNSTDVRAALVSRNWLAVGREFSGFFWFALLCPNYHVCGMTGSRQLWASLSPCLQALVQAQPRAMGRSNGDPPEEHPPEKHPV